MRSIVLVVLSLLIGLPCSAQGAGGALPGVIAHKVQQRSIADTVEALGTLRSNESVTLTAQVTETISKIHFQDGQTVEENQLLVELNSREQQALLNEAQSRLSEAERQYERLKPLKEGGAASASLVDERLREYETAKAQVAALQSRLEYRQIKAPFAGVLGLRNISEGALVTPGTEIVTLDDVKVMKLDFSIPSTFVSTLREGIRISATSRDLPQATFEGTVASIDSRIDPVTRSIAVRALIDNPERKLKPGMLMSVKLFKNEREAIVIPEEAIISEGTSKYVYLITDSDGRKKVEKREIVGGERQAGVLEVLSGLSEGEDIVVHGTIKIRPGQEVSVRSYKNNNEPLPELLRSTE